MLPSDPLQVLLTHDRWATDQLLEACAKLTPEQFRQRFDIGPGSLHDTLTHLISALRAWTDTLSNTPPRGARPRLEDTGRPYSPEQLREIHATSYRELTDALDGRDLSGSVTRHMRDGRTFEIHRAAVLAQVVTHGSHHRAQCLNMLKRLGVQPLPGVSVVEWTWAMSKA